MTAILLVIFVLLPGCGIIHALRVHAFARQCVRMTAAVTGYKDDPRQTRIRKDGLSQVRRIRYPIVRLCSRDGAQHTVTLKDARPRADRGDSDTIEVIFPEGRPDLARVAHWRARYAWPLFWFLPALWALVFMLCVVMAYYAEKLVGA